MTDGSAAGGSLREGSLRERSRRTRVDADELARLEEERDFLLRSLDDLDAEWAAGEVEEDEYRRLRDDYTARAAAALRALEEGLDARPTAPPLPARRRVAAVAAVLVFVAVAAVLLSRTLGERVPGESLTGNDQLREDAPAEEVTRDAASRASESRARDLEELRAAVEADPDDVEARLAHARALLADGQALEALRAYDEVVRIDPGHGPARVSAAMIVYEAGLPEQALERLDEAVEVAPDLAEAHFFRGLVRAREGRDEGAVSDLRRSLRLAPDGPFASDAEIVLETLLGEEPERAGEGADDRAGE